jgi:hypothetical protein
LANQQSNKVREGEVVEMKESNERPVYHRAEDLVTYLYDEANETEARDFANHAAACDACRAELVVFRQVHESISLWRNEALGSAFSTATVPLPVTTDAGLTRAQPRRLSALGALREFFTVSPLWLRGATAFAALLLSVLAVLTVSRLWNKPAPLANNPPTTDVYSKQQFDAAVAKEVKLQMEVLKSRSTPSEGYNLTARKPVEKTRKTQLAENRTQTKARPRGLTRQEREQLAADLRLISRDDDDLPFVFSEEPNQ